MATKLPMYWPTAFRVDRAPTKNLARKRPFAGNSLVNTLFAAGAAIRQYQQR